jgi:hypothetical protein
MREAPARRKHADFTRWSAVSGARRRAAKTEFKAGEALKASTTPSLLTAAYKAMNIRDDDEDKSQDDK